MLPFETEETLSVFIKIPESLTIPELDEKYQNAIEDLLASTGFGEATGSCGVHRTANCAHEIPCCGINVDLFEDAVLELLRTELLRLNAPTGTVIEFTNHGVLYFGIEIHGSAVHELQHPSDPWLY